MNKKNLRCAYVFGNCKLNLNSLAAFVPEKSTFIRTHGHVQIDSAIYSDQEYIFLIWSETLPSDCHILFNESSTPFYSTRILFISYTIN